MSPDGSSLNTPDGYFRIVCHVEALHPPSRPSSVECLCGAIYFHRSPLGKIAPTYLKQMSCLSPSVYFLCPHRHIIFKGVGAQRFHGKNQVSSARSPPCGVYPRTRAKIMAKNRPSNFVNHISDVSVFFRGPGYVNVIPLFHSYTELSLGLSGNIGGLH